MDTIEDEPDVVASPSGAVHPLDSHTTPVTTPPVPPPDFNPPADDSISPVHSISSPADSPDLPNPTANASSLSLSSAVRQIYTNRPQLRDLQRVSNDSIRTPASEGSTGTPQSGMSLEFGEHLAEARDRLLSESESSTPDVRSRQGSTEAFEVNLITPTPPMRPMSADSEHAGPSSRRTNVIGVHAQDEEGHDLSPEHAWDSVWPAAGASHRPIPPDPGPSAPRFPSAPVDPYSTPSFSPAIIPVTSQPRKPNSPALPPRDRQATSPIRLSPRKSPDPDHSRNEYLLSGRRRSVIDIAPSPAGGAPPVASTSRHTRSYSNSSPTTRPTNRDSLERMRRSPPLSASPPGSPLKRGLRTSPPHVSGSLASVQMKKQGTGSGSGPSRLTDLGVSPPSSAMYRPRGKSMSGIRPPLEQIERRDSPHPHFSPQNSQRGFELPPSSTSEPSFTPISLPPAVVATPVTQSILSTGDDGMSTYEASISPPPAAPSSGPLFAPSARPGILRRALSDYDGKQRSSQSGFHRTLSITAELDKSPKRTPSNADIWSPVSPNAGVDPDQARVKKSPRMSPRVSPRISPRISPRVSPRMSPKLPIPPLEDLPLDSNSSTPTPGYFDDPTPSVPDHMGVVGLMDEGDVLPSGDFTMDVTFDDEGLNTLERIFLLSKSDYPFHRSYVARVLGDLLNDVDPCESVEYVLPLLSGFSMDEDESVKEAFASELHRILWYFYSTCKLVGDPDVAEPGEELEPAEARETLTITSEGVSIIPTPTAAEIAAIPIVQERRNSAMSVAGPSSAGSSLRNRSVSTVEEEGSTPASAISESDTVFSPDAMILPYIDDADKGYTKSTGPLVGRPLLAVSFFTPLLGSLLLNSNPVISEFVRSGVVSIIARLRRKSLEPERWGAGVSDKEPDERRIFASQTGPHSHDIRPFDDPSRAAVEAELLQGIVLGMGQLATEMPDNLFQEGLDNDQRIPDEYNEYGEPAGDQAEIFRAQLIAEATAGRATSMNLIGAICEHYNGEEAVEKGFVDEVLRCGDGDVSVRAEAAVAMSLLAKNVPIEQIYNMIAVFEEFLSDPTSHVRQSACLCLSALCERIESPDYRRSFAVKAVQALNESEYDVRCALLEMMGEVIYTFKNDARGPPIELLQVYMDAQDESTEIDGDWAVVASFNLPGVCLTLGPDRWHELRELYKTLQQCAGGKVMRTLAASLHELAKVLYPADVEADLLPVYRRCLEHDDEIRERVFEHVDVILSRMPEDRAWHVFLDLARAWREKDLGGWRAREQLALHIPSFFEIFIGKQRDMQVILSITSDALSDPFAAVRQAAVNGVPRAHERLEGEGAIAEAYRNMLLDLSNSGLYRKRLTFLQCVRQFIKPPPNRQAFEEFFLPALPRLSQDVVDVRLGLAQIVADLFSKGAFYADETVSVPRPVKQLVEALAQDDAVDVRDVIRHIDLVRISKGKEHIPVPTTEGRGTTEDLDAPLTGSESMGQSRPTPGSRRPSADVAAKLDYMNLDTPLAPDDELQSTRSSSPTPAGRGGRGGGGGEAIAIDPFEASFEEAIPTTPSVDEIKDKAR